MTDYFFDSSALVKRYLTEPGTTWVLAITNPPSTDSVFLVEISMAEVAAAIAARQRAPRGFSVAERDQVVGRFLQDCAQRFLIVEWDRSILDLAVTLTQRYRLRGYDAVQLAAALAANQDLQVGGHVAPVLGAADNHLLLAAQAEGLLTDNPLDHTNLDPSP